MSDQTTSQEPSSGGGGRKRRRYGLFGALTLVAATLAAIPFAFADGRWGGRWGGCHHGFGHGDGDAEQMRDHASRAADHLLGRVDASDEQRAQVDAILDAAVPDFFALKTQGRTLREAFHAAALADDPDREGLEALRQEALGLADEATSKALDTMLDVHGVLDAEQRSRFQELVKDRFGN